VQNYLLTFGANSSIIITERKKGNKKMKHSREEIIKALKIIQETCIEHQCEDCPFGNDNAQCTLRDFIPVDYHINEEEPVWRAFQ
jgi:hypothetical protein